MLIFLLTTRDEAACLISFTSEMIPKVHILGQLCIYVCAYMCSLVVFGMKLHELTYFWYISAPPYSIRSVAGIYQK